ncbi:FAD/NAD(P)-binding protein [Dyella sp. A6]|uniref:FAD/NAD(P)-binding protein n=1 Tax=Dyella aluminiiresistens TaxID=3069105 RepID=UPI002E78D6FC|nr:FAD/NAD(P)-binding protein [Dyella sp. A6]
MFRRVAIIGGGAAGASLLSELLDRQVAQPMHLDWYAGPGNAGRGVAYATRSNLHLLNVRAATMGMYAHRPGGFLEYLRRDNPDIAGTDFVPRRLYGDYLEEETAQALARARTNGHDVHVVPFAAEAVVPERDAVTVLHSGVETRVDAAVLALGTLPARPQAGVSAAALDSGRYVVEPWQWLSADHDEPPPRQVVLVGLGLTSVDVLLELANRWPETQFVAISRHGRLPEAHQQRIAAPFEDGDTLPEAMLDAPEIRTWLPLLREACNQHGEWRSVIDGLRPYTASLWRALSQQERARFLRHARWAWERARHRMAPQVDAGIAALVQQGRLRIAAARMRSAEPAADGRLSVELVHAGQLIENVQADLVIQATGLETDVGQTTHPLVRQLVTNGHILPDPLGLGCQAEPDGRLRYDGGTWSRLFALGGLLRGTLWESIAMPEIRQQARQLTDRLLDGK